MQEDRIANLLLHIRAQITTYRQTRSFFNNAENRPLSSYPVPLFQNESSSKIFHEKISLICINKKPVEGTHFKSLNGLHEDSFWHRGKRHLGNGLIRHTHSFDTSVSDRMTFTWFWTIRTKPCLFTNSPCTSMTIRAPNVIRDMVDSFPRTSSTMSSIWRVLCL